MSYVVLARSKSTGEAMVLDTSDLITEVISDKQYMDACSMGILFVNFSKLHSFIGLTCDNNNYELFVDGYSRPIYYGKFPSSNNRNDLIISEIKLADFGMIGDTICLLIACNCWCKYDIEFPMVMIQVVSIPVKNFRSGAYVSVYTSKPVYFCSENFAKKQYEECFGDFPSDCTVEIGFSDKNLLTSHLRVFGVDYGTKVPYGNDICSKLKFLNLRV